MASTAQRKWNQGQEQLAGKLENTQKKTFTKWVNSQLAKGGSNRKVVDIFEDLKDGLILMNLVKIFTDAELPHNLGTRLQRPQMIANVEQVLSYLEPLVGELTGVAAPLIVDGDHSVTLGLVWRLILHFQVAYKMGEAKKTDKSQLELKNWAKDITEPYGIEVHNFTSSWSDGRAFCALAHCHWPHLLDYKTEVEAKRPQRNLELAFAVFERNGVEGLLEPEDFVDKPDEKSVVLYVSSIRKHIVEKAHEPPESHSLPAQTVTVHVGKQVTEPKSPTSSGEQLQVTSTTVYISTPKSSRKGTQEVAELTVSPVTKSDGYMTPTNTRMPTSTEDVSDISDSSTFIDGASYSMSLTSGAEKSDSTPKNGEELVTWATEKVEALKPFQLGNTLDIVKEQKQQCETLLSTMVQRGKVIFTVEATKTVKTEVVQVQKTEVVQVQKTEVVQVQKTKVVQALEQTDSQKPKRKSKLGRQATIDRSPAQYLSYQQPESLDGLRKRIEYMKGAARPEQVTTVITEHVEVKVKARWERLVLDLEGWKRLLDACIAAWEKNISTEDKLRKIEEQHAKWGPPAENRDVLDQFHALKTFQTSRVVPFKSEVSAMTESVAQLKSLGGHPPVDDLCRSVSERYNWLVSTVDTKCTTTQECCQVVQEYEQVKQPFEAWVTKAVSDINELLQQASDCKKAVAAKEKLEAIQKVAMAKEKDVSALSELATKFEETRKPVLEEVSAYHTKLQSLTPPPVTMAAMKEGTTKKPSTTPSIDVQTSNMEKKREWVLDQSIAPPKPPPCFPDKVVLEGIPQGTLRVGQQYNLQADISSAGDGQLKAELSGPTKHELCTMEEAPNKKVGISFTPKEVGKHKVDILFAGTAVPQSPLEYTVVDPSLVKVTPPSPNKWGVFTKLQPHIYHINCPTGTEPVTATVQGRKSGKEFGASVQDLGDKEYIATVIAPTPDKYDVKFYYCGHLVPSSPYLLPVEEDADPNLVTCTIFVSPTGKICVEADTHRSGAGKLSAAARGNKAGAVDCKTESKGTGKWVLSFNPPMPDVYTVHVYWNDVDVPHSPFTISTIRVDASKVRVEGPHSKETPVLTVCDTSEAGEGTLAAKCTSNRFGEIPVEVTPEEQHKQNVLFAPPGKDKYTLSILWDGIHIPGSPFDVERDHPDASKVKVDGPHPCPEGTGPVNTYIDASEAGNGDLQVQCVLSDEEGGPVEVTLTEKQPGHYTAVFEAGKPGTYKMDVTFNGDPVPESPFGVTIEKGIESGGYAWGPIVLPFELPREVTQLNGHVVYKRTDKVLHLDIDSGAVPGTFKCTFKPEHPGLHEVHINNGHDPIQGSPFEVLVKPPLQPVVTGLHGTHYVNEAVPFQVDCTKAGVGDLVIKSELSSQKGQKKRHIERTSLLDTMKRAEPEGLYDGTFVPKVAGEHLVYIDWCGTAVEEAPFLIQAIHRKPMTLPKGFELGKPAEIEVFGNLHDTLSASAVGDNTGHAPVTIVQEEGNRRSVHFTPLYEDNYTLSVFLNESHIEGSPFRIEVGEPKDDNDDKERNGDILTTLSVSIPQPYLPCEIDGARPNGFIDPEDVRALSNPLEMNQPCTFRVNVFGAGPGTLEVSSNGPSRCDIDIDDHNDEHNGIYTVKCRPHSPGEYTFKVHWNETPVHGSPLTVRFALPIVITGLNLATVLFHVGTLYKFHARTDAIGKEDFKVTVAPASGAQVRIFEVWDLNYHVSVLPQEVGEHKISVTYGGQHIFGSPFRVDFQEQGNASKCILLEEDQPMEDGKVCFMVDTKEAGAGELTAEVQRTEDKSNIPCEVEAVKGTFYQVCFDPQAKVAEYLVSIKYDGAHIPRSPFQLVLSGQPDASACRAEGDGLQFAEANKESQFVIYTDCTDADLKVRIDGEYEVVKPFIKDKHGGVYSVHYVPKFPGDYSIDILWDGQPIAGSPFTASVLQPLKAAKITVDRSSTGDVTLGSPVRFRVMAKDKTLAQKLKVVAYLPNQAIVGEVIEHGGQSYTASFDPPEAGNYQVIVSCENQQVPGSPFTVRVCQPPLPNKVRAYGRGLREGAVGHTCDFTVDTNGAGAATLVVDVSGPNGPVRADIRKIPKDERAVLASFLPIHQGEYTVAVLWADTHITSSPFKVDVHIPNKAPHHLDESAVSI